MTHWIVIKEPADVEALARERYPESWQGPERAAFVEGFLLADPSKARKDPERARRPYGKRTGVFRALEPGQSVSVPLRDSSDWALWRTTASYLKKVYGCRFKVTRGEQDRNTITIIRNV